MSLLIRLLGTPSIERDGARVRLPGRKTWALLAMLVIGEGPVRRQRLIDVLTTEADDPQAALRWLLHTDRRALGADATIVEGHAGLHVECRPQTRIDIVDLLRLAPVGMDLVDVIRGDLLDGVGFNDSATLTFWLTVERARIRGVASETMWHVASTLAPTDPEGAIRVLRHALSLDPYFEALHELLVDLLVKRGDMYGARTHAEATRRLFRDELGIEASESIVRALERRPSVVRPPWPSAPALLPRP